MKPNWFVGYPVLDGPWRKEALEGVPDGMHIFSPADLHLTLAFLGGVSEGDARRAWTLAQNTPPQSVTATLHTIAPFGKKSRPSAFSMTLARDEAREELCRALQGLGAKMRKEVGLEPEKRSPRPHITVARPGFKASDALRSQGLVWCENTPISGARTRLDRIALYTWSRDRRKSLFRIVEEMRLISD